MDTQNTKEITNAELLESISQGFSRLEKKIDGTQYELRAFKLETNIHFNNLESELRSFKDETHQNFEIVNEKIDDLTDVVMNNHEKRIEALEERVFADAVAL